MQHCQSATLLDRAKQEQVTAVRMFSQGSSCSSAALRDTYRPQSHATAQLDFGRLACCAACAWHCQVDCVHAVSGT